MASPNQLEEEDVEEERESKGMFVPIFFLKNVFVRGYNISETKYLAVRKVSSLFLLVVGLYFILFYESENVEKVEVECRCY